MNSTRFERAQTFIWKNARLIDRHLFSYLFCRGSRDPVITALKAYQNPDGGFGNALEPDKRAPESQPVDAQIALDYLGLLDLHQDEDAFHRANQEIILPMCDFLQSISTHEGGVPFALPSVNRYPHAPWWTTEENPPASLNPTAEIVGLLLKFDVRHPWIEKTAAYCWQAIESTETTMFHDLMPVITFLENAPDRTRAEVELERIARRIQQPGVVEMDPEAQGYVKMPLDWAPHPTSFCRRLFDDEVVAAHLKALARRQQSDGGWPINWDPISPTVELEWRGMKTVLALRTLQAYESAGFIAP